MEYSTTQRIALYVLLLLVGAVLLAPFAWLLSTALKAECAEAEKRLATRMARRSHGP